MLNIKTKTKNINNYIIIKETKMAHTINYNDYIIYF